MRLLAIKSNNLAERRTLPRLDRRLSFYLRAGLDTASCANPDRKPQILLVQIIVHLRLCAWRSRLLARLMDGDWVADSSQKRRRNKICAPPSRIPLCRQIFSPPTVYFARRIFSPLLSTLSRVGAELIELPGFTLFARSGYNFGDDAS